MRETIRILVKPHNKRGHYEVMLTIEWGNLNSEWRDRVGYHNVLEFARNIIAQCPVKPEEKFFLDMDWELTKIAIDLGLPTTTRDVR